MKSLTAKANAVSQAPNTDTNNQASTEGAIGDSDTTNNRVIDVSETTSSDATGSRTNDDATVNQETTNAKEGGIAILINNYSLFSFKQFTLF